MQNQITDMIIIDARALQVIEGARPICDALRNLISEFYYNNNVKVLFSRHYGLPDGLALNESNVIYAVPNKRNNFIYIDVDGYQYLSRSLTRPQLKGRVNRACLKWSNSVSEYGDYVVSLKNEELIVCSKREENLSLSDLDDLIIDEIDKKFLILDDSVCNDRDLYRVVMSLAKAEDYILLRNLSDKIHDDPRILQLNLSTDLINRICIKSVACIVADGQEPQNVNIKNVLSTGANVCRISANIQVKSVSELKGFGTGYENTDWHPDNIINLLAVDAADKNEDHHRIALVTPMFPDKGGPPHSSLDLALELTKICVLDVWTNSPVLPEHARHFENVYKLDSDFNPEMYDEIIYVLGNHKMYDQIFSMMLKYGGLVIQHDAHMIDFINQRYGHDGLRSVLIKETGEDFKFKSTTDIIKSLKAIGKPLLSPVLEPASSVVVHSPASRDIISQCYDVDVNYLPVGMPYTFNREDILKDARIEAKRSLGVDLDKPCIVSFGEVHMLKGAKQCLLAMYELKRLGTKFQFLFVGPILPDLKKDLDKLINNLGLSEFVKITDSVSEDEYSQYLQAGDIVLQIRQIPFGQLSGALLDAVSAGMHGVSSEGLAAAIEAPNNIIRVDDRASPFEYANKLYDLISSKSYEDRTGNHWVDFNRKHSFEAYAKNLVSLIFG